MAYDPELVKELLGESVASMMDGTIEIKPSKGEMLGNLRVGDTLTFKFKDSGDVKPRQFMVK